MWGLNSQGRAVIPGADLVDVLSGHKDMRAGTHIRAGGIGIVKGGAFGCEAIQVRCFDMGMAVTPVTAGSCSSLMMSKMLGRWLMLISSYASVPGSAHITVFLFYESVFQVCVCGGLAFVEIQVRPGTGSLSGCR